ARRRSPRPRGRAVERARRGHGVAGRGTPDRAAHEGRRIRRSGPVPHPSPRSRMMSPRTPLLGITMGDPAGVGPEITAKALAPDDVRAACRPVVIGDRTIMAAALDLLHSPLVLHAVERVGDCAFAPGTIECLDLANVDAAALPRGAVSAEAGRAAYAYIERGVRLCQSGEID